MRLSWVGFFLLISLPCIALAQVTEEWVARYNGPGNSDDKAEAMAVDDSGNIYVTGWSTGSGTWQDYATVKYNSAGVEQWVARYDGPLHSFDGAVSIALDNSGNVYVTGSSLNLSNRYICATIKYNSVGVEQWVVPYRGPGNYENMAKAIVVDNSDNVYVTGYSDGPGWPMDYVTIKYDSAGVEQWAVSYNGSDSRVNQTSSIAVDNSGNVYVTGWSYGSGTHYDYATVKYNSAGVEKWVGRYNGPENLSDQAYSIAVDNSGNVYVTGVSNGLNTMSDCATVKYNSRGVEQWVARYNDPENARDGASSLALDNSGNVYVTGYSENSSTFYDYVTIKYSSTGKEQWVARYNGPGDNWDEASSMAVDNSGNVYVTGLSYSTETEDYATIKYNAAGVEQWVARYSGPGGMNEASCIKVNKLGNVYVTGYGVGLDTWYDFVTIKYSQGGSVTEATKPLPARSFLEPPRPNPASGPVEIRYSLPAKTKATLSIYDVSGKLVKSFNLTINQLPITSIVWDGRDNAGSLVPNGLYFIQLETSNYSATVKFVMVRTGDFQY